MQDEFSLEGMEMLFFTSDLHLGHQAILQFANRPYWDIDQMNDALIENINRTVGADDGLYILGDLSYRISKEDAAALIKRIHCQNLHLIVGNHDKNWHDSPLFVEVADYKELKLDDGVKVILFHYPILD